LGGLYSLQLEFLESLEEFSSLLVIILFHILTILYCFDILVLCCFLLVKSVLC
jgi:hypothetical protein